MPVWMPMLITIVVAVLAIAANAIINTTIKFAPDAASARQDLKRLGSRVLRYLLNVAMALSLAFNVLMPGPVTGVRVFVIALGVGAIVYALVTSQLIRVASIQHEMLKVMDQHLSLTASLADRTDRETQG